MVKKNAGSATEKKLIDLAAQLETARADKKKAEDKIAEVTQAMKVLTATFTLPIKDGKSEYFNLPEGGAVRVTRPSAPVRKISTVRLLTAIRDRLRHPLNPSDDSMANHVFLDVFKLPDICDIDFEAWSDYVEDETLVDSLLVSCLEDQKAAPAPSVQLTTTKKVQ